MFYVSTRPGGGTDSDDLWDRVGPLKKDLTRAGGGEGVGERSGSFVRVLRVLEALAGSFDRVLRVWEAPGRDSFRRPMKPGGSAREDLTRAGGGEGGRGGWGGSGAVGSELRSELSGCGII